MNTPEDLKYSKQHEWVRTEGNRAIVGITDHAQETLGDIVYIELPEADAEYAQDDEVTTIESVKAAEPIYAPVGGRVVEANTGLNDAPESINKDPYGAYLFVMEMSDPKELDALLDAAGYRAFVESEADED
jgi:glycine cleavage system H protein